jgi:hypothetical protein
MGSLSEILNGASSGHAFTRTRSSRYLFGENSFLRITNIIEEHLCVNDIGWNRYWVEFKHRGFMHSLGLNFQHEIIETGPKVLRIDYIATTLKSLKFPAGSLNMEYKEQKYQDPYNRTFSVCQNPPLPNSTKEGGMTSVQPIHPGCSSYSSP